MCLKQKKRYNIVTLFHSLLKRDGEVENENHKDRERESVRDEEVERKSER